MPGSGRTNRVRALELAAKIRDFIVYAESEEEVLEEVRTYESPCVAPRLCSRPGRLRAVRTYEGPCVAIGSPATQNVPFRRILTRGGLSSNAIFFCASGARGFA